MNYKIAIHRDNFYKEIKLGEEWNKGLLIGTTKECQMRFADDSFNEDFVVKLASVNGQWTMECTDSVRMRKDNNLTNEPQYLMPLDIVEVRNFSGEKLLFILEFSIDFVEKTTDFDRKINCAGCSNFTVGGMAGCSVKVLAPVLSMDYVQMTKSEGRWFINTNSARYGILLNGFPVKSTQVELRNKDIFSINGFSFYWKDEVLYTSKDVEVETGFPMAIVQYQKNHLQYPRFVRSARQQFVIPKEKVDILPPKTKPEEEKKNLIMTMVPILVSMGMMVMMRMAMGGSALFALMCVGMSSVSIVMAVINYRNETLVQRKKLVKRENDYNRYIAEQEIKIQEVQEKERIISRQKYPTVQEQLTYVEDFDARLFEKQKVHDDYLCVHLGEGIVPSQCEVSFKKQEYREVEDPLMDYPEKMHEKYQYIADMPVMLDLAGTNAVGFVGDRTHLYQMAKNLLIQFAVQHYYQDVKLFLLLGKEDVKYFEWARWFRNTYESESGMRYFAYDDDSRKASLEYLYGEMVERSKMKDNEIKNLPTYIVFAYRSDMMGEHPVSNYMEKAADLGFVFLFFEEYSEQINPYCSKRIFLSDADFIGYVQDINDGEQIQNFRYGRVPMDKAIEAATKMACVYVDEVSLEASLTKNITLYQLLGIMNVYDLDIAQRWKQSKIYNSMAAPLGVKSGDEIVYLDLHEKYHGPHGLVAGTTGSGKSEILQSYILSMATLFHPYEVGFIIIDFKGGGMANQFRKLPHLNGAITNIDGKAINRSLASIKAELRKRQQLFAQYNVNHINDYIRLFKEGEAEQPLPHLILIVDEFAELKSEQPEFMKELISAARIGRSLGVHLILATQKPSGVVNEQIWSNSKFKLCLKVQNQSDSNEVIKSPLAAEIREPGRAYLQVGNNEIFQLFQSAYSGAPVPNGALGETKEFRISKVALSGKRQVIYEQKAPENKGAMSQLDAIVDYVEEFCNKSGIERLPDICLPPLEEKIPYTAAEYKAETTDVCVPIGMYDAPDRQYQGIMDVNFTQGHVFVVGSSQMGKTNLLQTMIRGLVTNYSVQEVQIYLLDFASSFLKNFQGLKHVGDVIVTDEEDKVKQFFKFMEEEIGRRKDTLSQMGLSSYAAYRESGEKDMPQIVMMIDNVSAFRELNSAVEDKLVKVIRDGSSVGICVVVTTQQSSGLGFRYLANFPKRLAFYCNDSGEYSSVLERGRGSLDDIPGRCLFSMDKESYEGQIYDAFPADKEIERVKEIQKFIKVTNAKWEGQGASSIPTMPKVVTKEFIQQSLAEPIGAYEVAIGINYENLNADAISLESFPILGIIGEKGMGRTNFIRFMMQQLLDNQESAPVHIHVIDSEEHRLQSFANDITTYGADYDTCKQMLKEVLARIEARGEMNAEQMAQEAFECIIINSRDIYEAIGRDEEILGICKLLMNEYENRRVTIILSDVPNVNLMYEASPLIASFKYIKNLVMFMDLDGVRLEEIAHTTKKKYQNKPLKVGEMYFKCGDYFAKYKTALCSVE